MRGLAPAEGELRDPGEGSPAHRAAFARDPFRGGACRGLLDLSKQGHASWSCWKWCLPARSGALREPTDEFTVNSGNPKSMTWPPATWRARPSTNWPTSSPYRHTVSKILERRGVSRRYRKLSPEQLDLDCTLYRDGLSLTKVSKQLGRRAETVRQALMKAGVEIRSQNGWTP